MTTQSQQILEDDSVARLTATGYAKVEVTEETSILPNLKARLEACNSFSMTAGEFNRVLWKQHIRSTNFSSEAKSCGRPVSLTPTCLSRTLATPPLCCAAQRMTTIGQNQNSARNERLRRARGSYVNASAPPPW